MVRERCPELPSAVPMVSALFHLSSVQQRHWLDSHLRTLASSAWFAVFAQAKTSPPGKMQALGEGEPIPHCHAVALPSALPCGCCLRVSADFRLTEGSGGITTASLGSWASSRGSPGVRICPKVTGKWGDSGHRAQPASLPRPTSQPTSHLEELIHQVLILLLLWGKIPSAGERSARLGREAAHKHAE